MNSQFLTHSAYTQTPYWKLLQKSLELIDRSSTSALSDSDYLTPILNNAAHSTSADFIRTSRNHPLISTQNPQELAHALIHLSQYPVQHFCEIGSFLGGTSILIAAYLKKFNPDLRVTIAHANIDKECLKIFEALSDVKYVDDYRLIDGDIDLCLLGKTDDFKALKELYNGVHTKCKICMFHHIHHGYHLENFVLTPLLSSEGIVKFWEELKDKQKEHSQFFEFSFAYGKEASQGIGLQILSP